MWYGLHVGKKLFPGRRVLSPEQPGILHTSAPLIGGRVEHKVLPLDASPTVSVGDVGRAHCVGTS